MKRTKYSEGSRAKENFERAMVVLFQVKKTGRAQKIKKNAKKGKD